MVQKEHTRPIRFGSYVRFSGQVSVKQRHVFVDPLVSPKNRSRAVQGESTGALGLRQASKIRRLVRCCFSRAQEADFQPFHVIYSDSTAMVIIEYCVCQLGMSEKQAFRTFEANQLLPWSLFFRRTKRQVSQSISFGIHVTSQLRFCFTNIRGHPDYMTLALF